MQKEYCTRIPSCHVDVVYDENAMLIATSLTKIVLLPSGTRRPLDFKKRQSLSAGLCGTATRSASGCSRLRTVERRRLKAALMRFRRVTTLRATLGCETWRSFESKDGERLGQSDVFRTTVAQAAQALRSLRLPIAGGQAFDGNPVQARSGSGERRRNCGKKADPSATGTGARADGFICDKSPTRL